MGNTETDDLSRLMALAYHITWTKLVRIFGRLVCRTVMLVLATVSIAANDLSVIRKSEETLANALKRRDEAVLLALTDKDFHYDWTEGSAIRSVSTVLNREQWIHNLMRLRLESYEAVISNIDVVKDDEVFVELNERWTIRSHQSSRSEKRIRTRDTWLKMQGTWKLTGRISQSYLR